jgi:hypothetical protein
VAQHLRLLRSFGMFFAVMAGTRHELLLDMWPQMPAETQELGTSLMRLTSLHDQFGMLCSFMLLCSAAAVLLLRIASLCGSYHCGCTRPCS